VNDIDDNEPIDQDIALVTRYLAWELSPAEREAMEERFGSDYEFYMKVAPLIRLWRSNRPRPPLVLDRDGEAKRRRRMNPWARLARGAVKYAAIVVVSLIGLWSVGMLTVPPAMETWQNYKDRQMMRAPSGALYFGEKVEPGPAGTIVAYLPGGSRVAVRAGSRFNYASDLTSGLIGLRRMSLDGEAAFEIAPNTGVAELETWAGEVRMDGGSYAVRCAPGCSEMLITVGAGIATVRGDSTRESLALTAGERGRVRKNGIPRKVTGPMEDWPALTTASEAAMAPVCAKIVKCPQ
jgi:hypothetical protein